jgi:hypothetical protein
MLDWPVPSGATPATSLKTWLDPLKQQLLGQDTFFAGAGQPPANLDWPVPKGEQPATSLLSWLVGTAQIISTQPFLVAGQPVYDWPVPKGPAYATSLRTWAQPIAHNLLSQDQFFADPGMGPAYDWPNPQHPRRSGPLSYAYSVVTTTLTTRPFVQRDWPVPRGEAFPADLRHAASSLVTTTLSVPFRPLAWPVPPGEQPAISLLTWAESTKLNLLANDAFFGAPGQAPPQLDWPNPRGYVPAITLRTWTDSGLASQPTDQFFGLAGNPTYDWPVPKGRRPNVVYAGTEYLRSLPVLIEQAVYIVAAMNSGWEELVQGSGWQAIVQHAGRRDGIIQD